MGIIIATKYFNIMNIPYLAKEESERKMSTKVDEYVLYVEEEMRWDQLEEILTTLSVVKAIELIRGLP